MSHSLALALELPYHMHTVIYAGRSGRSYKFITSTHRFHIKYCKLFELDLVGWEWVSRTMAMAMALTVTVTITTMIMKTLA